MIKKKKLLFINNKLRSFKAWFPRLKNQLNKCKKKKIKKFKN